MRNQTVIFDTIVPHPAPVQISDLLTEIETVIKRHVVLNDHAAAALAVWVLHTYTFELRDTVAYVAIESPEKRCGKTTLISVLAAMAHKPLIASNITVGALFSAIDTCSPTLFIDEADTFLAGNGTMRGIINSGNTRRAAYVLRLSRSKQVGQASRPSLETPLQPDPENSEPESGSATPSRRLPQQPLHENSATGLKRYSCWCPKVIAMIGEVPDTIGDRSIVVQMSRKLVTETCAPLAGLNTTEIKAKCARFALDAADSIAQTPKIHGQGLNDRAADTFDPLYVIARLAGNDWEKKLHAAAQALTSIALYQNSGSELLQDIISIFILSCKEKMFSRNLVNTLRNGSCGMRSLALKYSSINEYKISQVLRPYGIKPSTFRIGTEVNKGYICDEFREALKRYVPEADALAQVEEIRRRAQLHAEAEAETRKEEAFRGQFQAEMLKKNITNEPEAAALLRQMREEAIPAE